MSEQSHNYLQELTTNRLAISELERFRSNQEQGRAPGLWLTLHIDLGETADETAAKFLRVIDTWLSVIKQLIDTQGTWPNDEQWERLLPQWFVATFKEHSFEEIQKSDWLWDYSSWIDSMKNRVWWWWSYRRKHNTLIVELQLDSWPYSVGTLEYLARVAGGNLSIIEE